MRTTTRRLLTSGATVVLAAAALTGVTSGSAQAAVPNCSNNTGDNYLAVTDFDGTGIRIHTQASAGSTVLGLGNTGDGATFTDGEEENGGATAGYLYVYDLKTKVQGYVWSDYLTGYCTQSDRTYPAG